MTGLLTLNLKWNQEYHIERQYPQFFFLIYISGVFFERETRLPQITCLFFVDNLVFLAANQPVLEIKKMFERVGEISVVSSPSSLSKILRRTDCKNWKF